MFIVYYLEILHQSLVKIWYGLGTVVSSTQVLYKETG